MLFGSFFPSYFVIFAPIDSWEEEEEEGCLGAIIDNLSFMSAAYASAQETILGPSETWQASADDFHFRPVRLELVLRPSQNAASAQANWYENMCAAITCSLLCCLMMMITMIMMTLEGDPDDSAPMRGRPGLFVWPEW